MDLGVPKMPLQKICIDIDDTTFAFYEKIVSVFGEPPKSDHYLDMTETWPEFGDCITKLVNHAPFYKDLRMFGRANDVVGSLAHRFDIYFVTARPNTPAFIQVTDQQLQKNRFKYKDLIVAGQDKMSVISKIRPDYIIDDMPKYLIAAYTIGAVPIRMRQPYNKHTSPAVSVSSWYEIAVYFNDESKHS